MKKFQKTCLTTLMEFKNKIEENMEEKKCLRGNFLV